MYITDFEMQIEEKILLRGMKYVENGYVVDMWSKAASLLLVGTDPKKINAARR